MATLKTKSFAQIAAEAKANPERRARIDQYKRVIETALALGAMRSRRGVTQQEMAGAMKVTQPNVSRIEREENPYLSTLRDYVEALGGQLEINAVFPDETVSLLALNLDNAQH